MRDSSVVVGVVRTLEEVELAIIGTVVAVVEDTTVLELDAQWKPTLWTPILQLDVPFGGEGRTTITSVAPPH